MLMFLWQLALCIASGSFVQLLVSSGECGTVLNARWMLYKYPTREPPVFLSLCCVVQRSHLRQVLPRAKQPRRMKSARPRKQMHQHQGVQQLGASNSSSSSKTGRLSCHLDGCCFVLNKQWLAKQCSRSARQLATTLENTTKCIDSKLPVPARPHSICSLPCAVQASWIQGL